MQGILVINKAKDMTSHDVVNILRKKLNIKRIGHTGTLDPMVTGVLPICIGNATRVSEYIMHQGKSYICQMEFGKATDTYDSSGNVTDESDRVIFSKEEILDVLATFVGEIDQKPPIYSAVKIDGKKLYSYARKDETIEIPSRKVNIYSLDLLELDENKLKFEIACSKGTYVRSLVNDIGLKLNTFAYMTDLVRTRVGRFELKDTIDIEKISEFSLDEITSKMKRIEDSLYNLARIDIFEELEQRLNNGQKININHHKHELVKNNLGQIDFNNIMVFVQGKFLGIGKLTDSVLKMERVLKSD